MYIFIYVYMYLEFSKDYCRGCVRDVECQIVDITYKRRDENNAAWHHKCVGSSLAIPCT